MFLSSQVKEKKSGSKGHNKSKRQSMPLLQSSDDRLMLALEPRFLYDAAGLIAGVELVPLQHAPDMAFDAHHDVAPDTAHEIFSDFQADGTLTEIPPVFERLTDPVPPTMESPAAIIFVDPGVTGYEQLLGDVSPDTLVFIIDPGADGVSQIGDILSQYNNIESVHIISHGDAGQIVLGAAELSLDTIDGYTQALQNWATALSPGADILIYGCNVADGVNGQAFVAQLADITGADVAASNDPTGAADLGGDWDLEVNHGLIDHGTAISPTAQAAYNGLLANIEVTTAADTFDLLDGVTSLREALYYAADGDTISFNPGLAGQTITLTSRPLYFYSNATIDNDGITGPEDGVPDVNVTISGNNNYQVLVNWGYTAAIDGLTIQNGYAGPFYGGGGGIANYYGGTLTISDSTISNNFAYNYGGGIYNGFGGGTVNIYNSTISNNAANYFGGGIENTGTLNVTGSTIQYNYAYYGSGGGIDNYGFFGSPASTKVDNSDISYNFAYYGGGISNNSGSTLTVNNSTIAYNYAYNGGGIENGGTLNVTGSDIFYNNAFYVNGPFGPVGGYGGGIDSYGGTAFVYNSNVWGNFAYFSGGGIYNGGLFTVDNSKVYYNFAFNSGGGIYNNSTLNVKNGSIIGSYNVLYGNFSFVGGGIYNGSGGTVNVDRSAILSNAALLFGGGIENTGTLNVSLSTFAFNRAYYGSGGGIDNYGVLGTPATATVTDSNFYYNYAYYGGGISNSYGSTLTVTDNSLFAYNTAYTGGGIQNGGLLNVTDSILVYNKAYYYNSIFYGPIGGYGGGIDNVGGTVNISNTTIMSNHADIGGGGIYNAKGTVSAVNSRVWSNDADYGGGIFNKGGTVGVNYYSLILGNKAAYSGGGIYNNGGTVTVDSSIVAYNYAVAGSGGGIWNNNTLNVQNGSYVFGNYAFKGNGAGIYNNSGTVTVGSSIVAYNYAASGSGGGIYNKGGTVSAQASDFFGNYANYDGGGIWNSGTLNLQSLTWLYDNSAQYGSGGGIYNNGGTVNLNLYSIVLYNQAYNHGGGIYNNGGSVTLNRSAVAYNDAFYGYGGGIWNNSTLNVQNGSYVFGNDAVAGGGIYNVGGKVNVDSSYINSNYAVYAGSGILNFKGTVDVNGSHVDDNGYRGPGSYGGSGGGIFNYSGTTTITNSTVSGNYTSGYGGGIYNNYFGAVNIYTSTISNNYAIWGGGIENYGVLNVTGSTISNNYAYLGGGGIDNWTGKATITDSTISNNNALFGSGIFNYGGSVTVDNSTISNNYAYSDGGGIWNSGTLNVQNDSSVTDNYAYYGRGGGIYINSGAVGVDNSTISNNYAYFDGGGIYNYFGKANISSSTISYNNAHSGSGGGIYNSYGAVNLTNSTVSHNTAYSQGGGINNGLKGTLSLSHSTIAYNTAAAGDGLFGASISIGHTIVADEIDPNGGSIISNGYNLFAQSSVTGAVASDILSGNADLQPLADNGGPTWTHALGQNSDAFEAGNPAAAAGVGGIPLYDQRGPGYTRVSGVINIGSFEGSSPPIAIDDGYTTNEDTALNITNPLLGVMSNDSDPDGDAITVTASDAVSSGGGAVVVNADGTFSYDPAGQFDYLAVGETATDTFTYTIADTSLLTATATVTITITGVNDPPVANDDAFTTDENTILTTGSVLANDIDPDTSDILSVIAFDATGTKGTVTDNGNGTFNYDPNGQFDYLAAGETVIDTFTYTMSDGNGGTDTATVTITVTGANGLPTPVDDAFGTNEDTILTTGNVLANDADPDASDTLSVSGFDTTGTRGAVTDNGDGTFNYSPIGRFNYLAVGETAIDTFTYTVSDGNGGTATATVTITITGVNDAPIAVNDSGSGFTTNRETAFTTASVLGNDSDPEGDPLSLIALGTSGTKGTVTNNGNGTFNYNPNGQFDYLAAGETATDTFTYTISDRYGAIDTATVTITITGINDPPAAAGDRYITDEDTAITTGNVLANDNDPNPGDLLFVTGLDTTGTKGTVINNGDGTFDYDPRGPFDYLAVGESATDTFTYTVSDGNGGTATAMVTITITGVNDAPIAVDDEYTTNKGTSFTTGNVLINDIDLDASDKLSVTGIDTAGTKGTIINKGDGTFGYDPDGQFDYLEDGENAADTFTYTVSDGHGGTDTATVTITITGADEPGWLRDFLPAEDGRIPSGVGPGSSMVKSGGRVMDGLFGQGHPNPGMLETGKGFSFGFGYKSPGWEGFLSKGLSQGGNKAPTANADNYITSEDSSITTGNVLANDTDPNPTDILSVTGLDATDTKGIAINNGDGTFSYDPNGQFDYLAAGETATDTFAYTVSDGHGGTDEATVTITVTGTADNDAGRAGGDDSAGINDGFQHEKTSAAPGFNEQLKTAADRFETERMLFLGMIAGEGSQAA